MRIYFAATAISLLVLAGLAQACLTPSQTNAIAVIAVNNNVSVATLTDIFAVLCNRSYTKGEMDIWRQGIESNVSGARLLLATANDTIAAETAEYLDNYTAYISEKFSMLERLELVVNLTGESISLNKQMVNVTRALAGFEDEKERLKMTLEAAFDDKIGELRKTLADYVRRDDLPALQNQTAQQPYGWEQTDYTPYLALAIVVAALLIWKFRQRGVAEHYDKALSKVAAWRSPPVRSPLPSYPTGRREDGQMPMRPMPKRKLPRAEQGDADAEE